MAIRPEDTQENAPTTADWRIRAIALEEKLDGKPETVHEFVGGIGGDSS